MSIVNVLSEIPGNVWKIEIKVGATIAEGDVLVILESMKMEVPVQSVCSGEVTEIFVAEGDFVNEGDPILAIAT